MSFCDQTPLMKIDMKIMTLLSSSCALRTFCCFPLWLTFINFRRATFFYFIAKFLGPPWGALEAIFVPGRALVLEGLLLGVDVPMDVLEALQIDPEA